MHFNISNCNKIIQPTSHLSLSTLFGVHGQAFILTKQNFMTNEAKAKKCLKEMERQSVNILSPL